MSLSREERDFVTEHRGSWDDEIGREAMTPAAEVARVAGVVVERLRSDYESRTERLLVVSRLAERFALERDRLLDEILRGSYVASYHADSDRGGVSGWSGVSDFQPWSYDALASLAGYTTSTIRRRHNAAWRAVVEAAEKRRVATGETQWP